MGYVERHSGFALTAGSVGIKDADESKLPVRAPSLFGGSPRDGQLLTDFPAVAVDSPACRRRLP